MNRIERDVKAFRVLTGIPVTLMDAQGQTQTQPDCACCQILSRMGESICDKMCKRAAEFAQNLGETYLFACQSGLFHAVVATGEDVFVLAGPFALGEAEPWQIPETIASRRFSPGEIREMSESFYRMPVLNTEAASELCVLLYDLFAMRDEQPADDAKRRAMQQQRIAEALQGRKQQGDIASRYPIEKEDELIRYVKEGDSRRADAVLNELLGYAFFASGTLDEIRGCTVELCALLSRAAIEGGAESGGAVQENRELMRLIWGAGSIEEVCYFMQEAVERFCESAFSRRRTGEQECVQRAIRYIHMHYAEPLSLSRMAGETHLSESYFSTLFKKGCGYGFREYLTKVRVDRARELLENTSMSVTEISEATGFDSQSYFSKVFRRSTGLAPSEYRERDRKTSATGLSFP